MRWPTTHTGLMKPAGCEPIGAKLPLTRVSAKIQGVVEIDVVVQADGTMARPWSRQVPRFHFTGLDDMALQAARAQSLSPGTLNGTPVPVLTR